MEYRNSYSEKTPHPLALGLGALLVLAPLSACGPSARDLEDLRPTRQGSGIIGGTLAPGDPAVVALVIEENGALFLSCSGTLIAPKTVLSAAHCVFPLSPSERQFAYFGERVPGAMEDGLIEIGRAVPHPTFDIQDPNTDSSDISVFELKTASSLSPIPLHTEPVTEGMPIRHVGFGATTGRDVQVDGAGPKREVTTTVRVVAQQIEVGGVGKGHCYGDSGGPGLVVPPGETGEKVASVVSWGPGACDGESWDTRVDLHVPWIEDTMSAWESEGPGGLEAKGS